eukprot:5855894-Pleurochrysis_carterae.AAC.1
MSTKARPPEGGAHAHSQQAHHSPHQPHYHPHRQPSQHAPPARNRRRARLHSVRAAAASALLRVAACRATTPLQCAARTSARARCHAACASRRGARACSWGPARR